MLEAFLNIILKESDRLQSLIYDLLSYQKLRTKAFVFGYQSFNLIDLLDEVNTLMMGKA